MLNCAMTDRIGRFVDWTREQAKKTQTCRSCDLSVSVSDTVCPRCGASDPAQVPMTAATAVFVLFGFFALGAIAIAYC